MVVVDPTDHPPDPEDFYDPGMIATEEFNYLSDSDQEIYDQDINAIEDFNYDPESDLEMYDPDFYDWDQNDPDTIVPPSINFIKNNPIKKYTTVKIPFEQFKNKDIDYSILENACIRVNDIVTLGYLFIRSYILYRYNNNRGIPVINKPFINLALKALSKEAARGKTPEGDNLIIYENLKRFYTNHFSKQIGDNNGDKKIDAKNLSAILSYSVTEMHTSINNNITLNFENRVNNFVNQLFKKNNDDILSKLTGKERKDTKNELLRELKIFKSCLLNRELLSSGRVKYRIWMFENRDKILPKTFFATTSTSYSDDVEKDPQLYFPYLIRMNLILEKQELKLFQIFPLRTEMTLKNIEVDTKAIIELYCYGSKTKLHSNIK